MAYTPNKPKVVFRGNTASAVPQDKFGSPLTNAELDGNFKGIQDLLGEKADITDTQFYGTTRVTQIDVASGEIDNTVIGDNVRSTGKFTTLAANNDVTFTKNASSTSTTSGTVVVTGGVGISENTNIGGSLTVSGGSALNGGITVDGTAFTVADGTGVVTTGASVTLQNTGNAVTVVGNTGSTTANVFNTVSTTVNLGGAATTVALGAAGSSGTATIKNDNVVLDGNLQVKGGSITTNQTAFNLLNATATTVNFAGAATAVNIGAAGSSGTATIKNDNVVLDGDLQVKGGDITTNQTTFNLLNATANTINFGGAATDVQIGAATGTTEINNNLNVVGNVDIDGGSLTASTTSFNLVNATATTLNIGGASTLTTTGATTGLTNVRNSLVLSAAAQGTLAGVAISNISGGFTCTAHANRIRVGDTITISGTLSGVTIADYTSPTTYRVSATNGSTTFTLVKMDGTAVSTSIGTPTGVTYTLNRGALVIEGAGGITTTQSSINVLNDTATTINFGGAATTIEIGSASGTTNVNNNLDVDGDVNIDGGDLTVSTTTFNLANTTATTLNIGGAATTVELGATTGLTNINNSLLLNGPSSFTITGVQITSTGGAFSCTAAVPALRVGDTITISGTFGGGGSITGYTNPTTYRVSVTNGSTTFTLTTVDGTAIVTANGTPTGLTYTVNRGALVLETSQGITSTQSTVNIFPTTVATVNLGDYADINLGGASKTITSRGNFAVASGKNFSQTGAGTFSTGTGGVTLNGNTSVSGSNTFTVGTGASSLGGSLTVAGTTTLNGNTSVSGANTFTVGTGATSLGGTLGVTGNTSLGGTLGVTDNVAVNTDKFTVTASNGNTVVAGTLEVGSTLTLKGGTGESFIINDGSTNKFTVDSTNGDTSTEGTLSVKGNVAVNTDKFTITATNGNTAIAGTLTVNGNTQLGDATGDSVRVYGFAGIGVAADSKYGVYVANSALSGTSDQFGVYTNITGSAADVTNVAGVVAAATTAASSNTTSNLYGLLVPSVTKGSNSTIINQYGVRVSERNQGNNNYGITAEVSAGTSINAAISNVVRTTNVVTITTSAAHNIKVGNIVNVAAVTNTGVNGKFVVTGVPTTTTFTYAQTDTNITSAADTGTVVGVNNWNLYSSGTAFNYINGALGIGNDNFTDKLHVEGTARVTSNTTLGGTLSVAGNVAVNTDKFTITASNGNTGIAGAATIGGALSVAGNVTVNTDKFTITATNGNTGIAGALSVSGNSTLTGTLEVGSTLTLKGGTGESFIINDGSTNKFTVDSTNGDTAVDGTLGVKGNVAVNSTKFTVDASTGNTVVAGTMEVGSTLTLKGGTGESLIVNDGTTNRFTVDSANGNTAVDGTLGVKGNVAVNSTKFTVDASTGNTAVDGTLGVKGNVTVNTDKFTITATNGNTAIAGTLSIGAAGATVITTAPDALNNASVNTLMTLAKASYRTVEYTIQATQGTAYISSKILAIHDGTNAYFTEYAVLKTGTFTTEPVFNITISGNDLIVTGQTPTTAASTTYKVTAIATPV